MLKTQVRASSSAASPLEAERRKIFLVDDHPLVRSGLVQLINQERT